MKRVGGYDDPDLAARHEEELRTRGLDTKIVKVGANIGRLVVLFVAFLFVLVLLAAATLAVALTWDVMKAAWNL